MIACIASIVLIIACTTQADNWNVVKEFDLRSMSSINNEWNIINWNRGYVNNERQRYLSNGRTIRANGAGLILNAYNAGNDDFVSGRLESKETFSPENYASKKIRVEFSAKVPTDMGAWPALWMLGNYGVYGNWPQAGEIDVMEWVQQMGEQSKAALHWKGPTDWGVDFRLSRSEMKSQYHTYGVEYSTRPGDQYIIFFVIRPNGEFIWSPAVRPDVWRSSFQPTVRGGPLTGMEPFDNQMHLILNVAVGGDWGGIDVSNYNAFNGDGVSMFVRSVKVLTADGSAPNNPIPTNPPSGGPMHAHRCERNKRAFGHYDEKGATEEECKRWCSDDNRCMVITYQFDARKCYRHALGYGLGNDSSNWMVCFFR